MLADSNGTGPLPRNRRTAPRSSAGTILFGIASPILPALENQWPSWLAPSATWKPITGSRSGGIHRRSL